jgi:hypothetical protein
MDKVLGAQATMSAPALGINAGTTFITTLSVRQQAEPFAELQALSEYVVVDVGVAVVLALFGLANPLIGVQKKDGPPASTIPPVIVPLSVATEPAQIV